ncbi:MAG TPA: hypothetical protein VMS64_08130 [Candidatus Methylomirabilis sp.]|nr:hypothetical protein [Candidatus Methylomirabilis sp.]
MPRVLGEDLLLAAHGWPGALDGLLTPTDCLMTQAEAVAMSRAIPKARLVVVPKTNHYTVLLGRNPRVKSALGSFLPGR